MGPHKFKTLTRVAEHLLSFLLTHFRREFLQQNVRAPAPKKSKPC